MPSREEIVESLQRFREGEHYAAIGEFVFRFSQLEFTIKARLFNALNLPDTLFDIITGPYDFAMMCTVAAEVLKATTGISEVNKKAITKYFDDCKAFNHKYRVIVAHALWTTTGARHVSRATLKPKKHFPDVNELKARCKELRILMQRITETKTD
jgi:hypothetical protein